MGDVGVLGEVGEPGVVGVVGLVGLVVGDPGEVVVGEPGVVAPVGARVPPAESVRAGEGLEDVPEDDVDGVQYAAPTAAAAVSAPRVIQRAVRERVVIWLSDTKGC